MKLRPAFCVGACSMSFWREVLTTNKEAVVCGGRFAMVKDYTQAAYQPDRSDVLLANGENPSKTAQDSNFKKDHCPVLSSRRQIERIRKVYKGGEFFRRPGCSPGGWYIS